MSGGSFGCFFCLIFAGGIGNGRSGPDDELFAERFEAINPGRGVGKLGKRRP